MQEMQLVDDNFFPSSEENPKRRLISHENFLFRSTEKSHKIPIKSDVSKINTYF